MEPGIINRYCLTMNSFSLVTAYFDRMTLYDLRNYSKISSRTIQISCCIHLEGTKLIWGNRFGFFIMDGKQYEVIGQMERHFRHEPAQLL
jgi:hypothetical protein